MFTLVLDSPACGAARLRPAGHLDERAARDVLHAAADVVRSGCSRLVLDLDDLTSWDDDARLAVTGCSRLARWLPEGVGIHASTPAGRALAASARCAVDERRPGGPAPSPRSTAAPATMDACHAC